MTKIRVLISIAYKTVSFVFDNDNDALAFARKAVDNLEKGCDDSDEAKITIQFINKEDN